MFELHQLRCFVAVASEMNFHRAAERLNMTQPPVSRQVQVLERQLGVQLFDRTRRSIRLTAAGERFYFEARDLLRRAEDAKVIARSVASGHLGNVSIAFIPIAAVPIVPIIATKLAKELPNIRIVLNEMMTGEQIERLRTGRMDIGILRRPDNKLPGEQKLLLREPYRLAVHCDHPFATREDITIQDLDDQNLLMYSPGHGRYGYELLNPMFAAKGVRPNVIQHLGQGISMLALVNAGYGMALVPDGLRQLRLENVVIRSIELPPEATADYHIVMSEDRKDDPAVRQVFEMICGAFGAEQ
ncbi:LysR family transcriptional regulator [Oceaniovalibus sp. ACAM 378]|uniref:LysR family transcriptional regulator n=1 Tax=Oceaniovalibus sp. ACAM 378 TaxID=2599923 RepID=UPI0011D3E174|nr:LysR family transcriptional regulator [Oceaniovalibus sp. ACAM 378]TYB85372.1 LysR family transcriptional regulator [Oceaniovalibus sp. ACAM 378]